MARKKSTPEFYNIRRLLKENPDCYYYLVYGERSNGKTYSALDYALDNYFHKGEQFAYIRRFGEDVRKKNLGTLFSAHIKNGVIEKYSDGVYDGMDYTSNRFIPTWHNVDTDRIMSADKPAGFVFDLHAMEHHKSTSYPDVTTIIFDEFLSRQGYLPNEFVLFTNTLSTIIRLRDNVKIIMLGNTVNKYCPYFQEMGLKHIRNQKQGSIDVYKYGDSGLSIAVEYVAPMAENGGKPSDIYFAFDNPHLKMITSGAWEISIYPHLEERFLPKDVVFTFFVEFERDLLQCQIVCNDAGYYMFVHPKTTPIKDVENDIVYTSYPSQRWNYRTGFINAGDKLSRVINTLIQENRIFYSDNETGEVLRNYIMWSENYDSSRGDSY